MITIDPSNSLLVSLDIYTVAEKHQDALINAIVDEQLPAWMENHCFVSASIHRSLSGVRVFSYTQWSPKFDPRTLPQLPIFAEFFPPESHLLEIVVHRPTDSAIAIKTGQFTVHLAEFRMLPKNQPEMIIRAASEVDRAMKSPGLVSATFHRSLDGKRVFNYGQWESPEAIAELVKQPGFRAEKPYWEGLARNEYHLYDVVSVREKEI
jgi:heme-degrading monooxygenase HmoA